MSGVNRAQTNAESGPQNDKTAASGTSARVSVHGGHSGEFCSHAQNSLDALVEAYAEGQFEWAAITEHIPPLHDFLVAPEERAAGLDSRACYARFQRYFVKARRLQREYAERISLYIGFETEAWTGYADYVRQLRAEFAPDLIVGSVHHVNDIPFDYSPAEYRRAEREFGGRDALYCAYFDKQYDMLRELRPEVVGHFDLIRLFDADYRRRLEKTAIAERIQRNLLLIKELGAVLDFNVRALLKGAEEPYVSACILEQALDLSIELLPGDDSHSAATVGRNIGLATAILAKNGVDTRSFRSPADRC